MDLNFEVKAYELIDKSSRSDPMGINLAVNGDYQEVRTVTVTVGFVDYVGDASLTVLLKDIKSTAATASSKAAQAEAKAQTAIDRAESGVKTFDVLFLEESDMDDLTVDEMENGILYCGLAAEEETTPSSYDSETGQLTAPDGEYDSETGVLTLPTATYNSDNGQLTLK